MIAKLLMIARKTKDIANSQCGCAQDVALQGETIPVSHDHLKDRFHAKPF
jgi:hypothetical protein